MLTVNAVKGYPDDISIMYRPTGRHAGHKRSCPSSMVKQ